MSGSEHKKAQKRQYDYENYHFFKSIGICVDCEKEKAFNGHVYCAECLYKRNERNRNRIRTEEQREHDRVRQNKKYYAHKEIGLCVNCGKKSIKGHVTCLECYVKQKKANTEYRIKTGRNRQLSIRGLCIRCGAEPVEGKKMCQECLDKARRSIEYARSFISKEDKNGRSQR